MLLLFHDTFLLVALSGLTVAVKVIVSPSVNEADVLSNDTLVTGYTFATTVTLQVAVLAPSSVFAVMVAVPGAIAVTTPPLTDATEELLEIHRIVLFSASEGEIVAVMV